MPICVENISHIYMPGSVLAQAALKDISFCVEEGEFWGIIGHTGSGKSTLIQHLNGLILPQTGRILVDGLDLADKKQRVQARSLVGMVFQYPEYQLFEESVEKDVAFGPRNLELPEEEIARRVDEALFLVGLAPDIFRNKSPFDLSGGEKRRVALAGIVAMRPKYLVLDEPMAGLDPRGRREVMQLIANLRKQTGCAIVMVSHSMDDIAGYADHVLVLSKGSVVLQGSPDTVFGYPEKLLELGLDVPQAAKLALALQSRGIAVPQGMYKMDTLRLWLTNILRKGGDPA